MLKLGIGGPLVLVGFRPTVGRRVRPLLAQLVECDPARDRVRPCPQVLAVLEPVVCPQGAEERLLKGVLGRPAPEPADEEGVNLVAARLVEALEGWDRRHGFHSASNGSSLPGVRLRP
jgi:hypothetical protein